MFLDAALQVSLSLELSLATHRQLLLRSDRRPIGLPRVNSRSPINPNQQAPYQSREIPEGVYVPKKA